MALNYIGSEVEVSVLPGFRFHPTDEELISFYLLRKLQNRALPGDVIKYLNLYHYDPWDLPCMAAVQGQNEWYFYSPRDKKYPNSARPNRATRSGFWKATGTDKFVYASDGSTRIGVKKSLVFYRGRATKGTKTEWTMQEFRLSASRCSSTSVNAKECESLAICRVSKQSRSVATSISRVKKAISIPEPRLLAAAASNKELAGQLSAIRDVLHACDEKKPELGSNKVIEWTKSGNELWTCATSSNHKELWQEIEELSAGDQQGSWMNVKPTKTILWEAMQTYEDLSSSFNMHWPTNNLHELQQMEMVWNTQTILESSTSSSMHSSDILLSNQTPSSFTYTQPLPPISPASWPPS